MRAAALSVVVVAGLVGLVLLYTPQQAQRGQKVYGENCAVCHGAQGSGGTVPDRFGQLAGLRAPALVGATALGEFKNAGELLGYVSNQMPLEDPGRLSQDQNLAVTVWLLQENGVKAGAEPLSPENAAEVPIR